MTNYIGRNLDKISNIEILDNITFNGSQSYTLQKGGVNFTPNSAQSIILGIDGITQIGNFSVNGSTIDFGVAVASSSTCNYIIHLGTGILTAPSDGSVTNAKLGTAPTLEAKGSGNTAGGVKYFCEQGSHGITLRSPSHSAYSGSYELVLPTAQGGANTFLKNDGSGNLSFAAAGGGKVLQVVSSTGTAGFDTNSGSFVQVTGTGHGVSITPSATTSKVFITIMFEARSSNSGNFSINTILRDSTDLSGGTRFAQIYGSSNDFPVTMSFLDSPNTNAQVTYRIGTRSNSSSHSSRINASNKTFSYVAMEIGA